MGLSAVCVMSDLAGPLALGTRGLLGSAASRRRKGGRVRTEDRPSFDARSRSQLGHPSSFSLEGEDKE
jgi:hypothetical protein